MSAPGIPQKVTGQTQNQQNLVSWAPVAGALLYTVYRSLDGVNYSFLLNTPDFSTDYLDTSVTLGTAYYYTVASVNTTQTFTFTIPSSTITAGSVYTVNNYYPYTVNTTVTSSVSVAMTGTIVPPGAGILTLVSGTGPSTIEYTAVTASGPTAFTSAQSDPTGPLIPAPTGEMALYSLRQATRQKADKLNSNFVTDQELNIFINLALNELYDILITVYEDYFMAPRVQFTAPGNQSIFPLPNGTIQFNSYPNQGPLFTAAPFYKLLGVDLGLQNANNAFVTINKYQLIDRNRFVYPNTASTIYGVFNLQYRLLGTNIEFIPTPSGGQVLQLLYIPRLPALLRDTDLTTIGFSGWLQYAIVRAAKYMLDKEESDTSKLDQEILYLNKRIEESAVNRDAGQPDKISDIRQGRDWGSGGGWGNNGAIGGF